MPIDIQNLHIKSSVVQRACDDGAAPADGLAPADDERDAELRQQILAECKRLIRDALYQRQER